MRQLQIADGLKSRTGERVRTQGDGNILFAFIPDVIVIFILALILENDLFLSQLISFHTNQLIIMTCLFLRIAHRSNVTIFNMALVSLTDIQLIRIRFTTGIIGLVQFPIMPQGWDGHMKCQCYFLFPHRNVAGRLGINMVACLCTGGFYRLHIGQRSDIAGVAGLSIDEKILFPCWQIEIGPHQSGIGNVGIHRILDGARLRIGLSIFAESSLTHCCQLRMAASAVLLILYRHGVQPTVAGKGTITDVRDRTGDHQGLKSAGSFCAVGLDVKRIASDGLQSLMKRQGAVWLFPEPVVGKSAISNACDSLRDLDPGQATGIEGIIGDCLQAFTPGLLFANGCSHKKPPHPYW